MEYESIEVRTFFSTEYVPLFASIVVIMPLAFEFVRGIVEDKMDIPLVVNIYVLRFAEIVAAFIILPSATVFVVIMISWFIFAKVVKLSFKLVDFLASPGLFSSVAYYASNFVVLHALLILSIILVKTTYRNMTEEE